jgi:mitochondrial fission protein ELM1
MANAPGECRAQLYYNSAADLQARRMVAWPATDRRPNVNRGGDTVNGGVTWVLTDGKAGTHNGALGLAEAVGLPVVDKHIRSALPWRWLPPLLWPKGVLGAGAGGDPLDPPWPRLIVSAGERAVGPALEIKRRAGGTAFCVHIQHPRVDPARFDLVVAPAHDRLSGGNVRVTVGALHRVTRDLLADAATRFAPAFAHLPRPLVAVLVGGANRVYRFNHSAAERLADGLAAMARDSGCGLLVTTSRRTGAANEALLRERLQGLPVEFWDGTGENPYFAYLALADALVVTGDSVNMVSEACFTGKPVYVFNLPGGARSKFGQFHKALAESGATRPFAGRLETWPCTALDERAPLADEIRHRLRNAGAAG